MRASLVALICIASPVWADEVLVPSGQPVTLHERIEDDSDPDQVTWRYRFLAPQIAKAKRIVSSEAALGDMDALCQLVALPDALDASRPPAQVVITLMDRPVAFGQADPDATQFFEAYLIQDGACAWGEF